VAIEDNRDGITNSFKASCPGKILGSDKLVALSLEKGLEARVSWLSSFFSAGKRLFG
jgi:hypothetical protein